jgi:hypothetical protein
MRVSIGTVFDQYFSTCKGEVRGFLLISLFWSWRRGDAKLWMRVSIGTVFDQYFSTCKGEVRRFLLISLCGRWRGDATLWMQDQVAG